MKIDINELERTAAAADQDEWQWRPGEDDVLDGKHNGQVVLFPEHEVGDGIEPVLIASIADRAHIAAASPPVVIALIARIRELNEALNDALAWYPANDERDRLVAVLAKGVVLP